MNKDAMLSLNVSQDEISISDNNTISFVQCIQIHIWKKHSISTKLH